MNSLIKKRFFNQKTIANQCGMTLLEVLVATGILAVISAMGFLSLDTLVKSKQSLQQVADELNQLNLAQFQLQSDVQMAITTNRSLVVLPSPEFIANSQSITLLRYRNAKVPHQRNELLNNQQNHQGIINPSVIRVRWYVRDDKWYRATQSAASPLRSSHWQERAMLDLKSLNCSYQNVAGSIQSVWPGSQAQNAQLPEVVNCQVQLVNGQVSALKLVPWQRAGWL